MTTVQSSIARNRAERRKLQNLPRHQTPTGNSIHSQRALRRREAAGKSEEGQRIVHNSLRHIPHTGKKLQKKYGKLRTNKRRVKAMVRGGFIAATLAPTYLVQLFLSFLFIAAMGTAVIGGIVGWFAEDIATAILMFCWGVLIAFGFATMLYAATMFTVTGVRVWRYSSALIMFAVCLAGYFMPILSFFPWVFLWIAVVAFAQK